MTAPQTHHPPSGPTPVVHHPGTGTGRLSPGPLAAGPGAPPARLVAVELLRHGVEREMRLKRHTNPGPLGEWLNDELAAQIAVNMVIEEWLRDGEISATAQESLRWAQQEGVPA